MSILPDHIKENFISSLRQKLDLNIADIKVRSLSESCFIAPDSAKKVPYLKLRALSDSYDRIIGTPERMGLVNKEIRSDILMLWSKTLETDPELKEDFYDPDMYIGADRYETVCYSQFAYESKDDVNTYLTDKLKKSPRGIFASSSPGINIVYETDDYHMLGIDDIKDELVNDIIKMARDSVRKKFGCEIECNLCVKFWHPAMENYNGYGLARQD